MKTGQDVPTKWLLACDRCVSTDWRRLIQADLVLAVGSGVLYGLVGPFLGRLDSMPGHPRTFWWLWVCVALYGIFRLARRLKVSDAQLVLVPLLLAPCLFFALHLLLPKVGALGGSENSRSWSSRYCGGWTRISNDYTMDPESGPQLDYPNVAGYLHALDCPTIQPILKRRLHHHEVLQADWFATWQTGLACRYTPDEKCIPQFRGHGTVLGWLKLFFTVGPVVVVECCLGGLLYLFVPLLAVQFLWRMLRKRPDVFEADSRM